MAKKKTAGAAQPHGAASGTQGAAFQAVEAAAIAVRTAAVAFYQTQFASQQSGGGGTMHASAISAGHAAAAPAPAAPLAPAASNQLPPDLMAQIEVAGWYTTLQPESKRRVIENTKTLANLDWFIRLDGASKMILLPDLIRHKLIEQGLGRGVQYQRDPGVIFTPVISAPPLQPIPPDTK
jgi:hypothetical protein